MINIQLYPLHPPLSRVSHHTNLPSGTVVIGRCLDNRPDSRERQHILVKHENHLSVLVYYHAGPHNQYYCDQYDFPLKTLSWFPWALEEFRKPPIEGGLHAGAMTTKDMDVDGEMLCIQNASEGYYLMNRSRNSHDRESGYYPMQISLNWEFLYKLGFLDLWKSLGEKYERGEI